MKGKSMRVFSTLWLGQTISIIGSGLTSFALGVWVFERTGSATLFAMIGLSAVLPRVLFSPVAGAIVDRYDRRWVMIASDSIAAVGTLIIALLAFTGRLEFWHIYPLSFILAAAGTLQWPAYAATTTQLVSKEQLGRANGMQQFGQAAADVLAPALAGGLMPFIQLKGVILIDFSTFIFALLTLLLIRFPELRKEEGTPIETHSWRLDLTIGWGYIRARRGLLGLLGLLAAVNFIWGMVGALIVPMILGFTTSQSLGVLISIAGVGMLVGGLLMSVWGGPRPRINGVLNFELLSGLCFIVIGLRPSFWPVAIGVFGAHMTIAIIYGSNQAIWQSKVPLELQGRVFAAQQMLIRASAPLAFLVAGPLAERLFEPWMANGGALSVPVGPFLGTGPGRGIGLMFVLMGITKIAITLIGYTRPSVRNVETELPDAIG
jgi:MFS family permease